MTAAKIAGKRKFGRRKSWGQWFVGDMFGAFLCIGRGENGKISGAKNAYLVVINSASALEVVQQACGVTQSSAPKRTLKSRYFYSISDERGI